jgi:hypothetical protein
MLLSLLLRKLYGGFILPVDAIGVAGYGNRAAVSGYRHAAIAKAVGNRQVCRGRTGNKLDVA